MKKSEIIRLLQDKLYEAEVEISDSSFEESYRYAAAHGILKGTITYILEKCDDIDE